MFPCQYRSRGCSALFERRFGLGIHLRGCIHKEMRSSRRKSRVRYPIAVEGNKEKRTAPKSILGNINLNDNNVLTLETNTTFEFEDAMKILGETKKQDEKKLTASEKIMLKLGQISRAAGRRSVSELVHLLRSEEVWLEDFREQCNSAKDCVELEEQYLSVKLTDHGFKLVPIKDPESGIECDVYMRSPIAFLKKQMEGSSAKNTVFNPTERSFESEMSHPMTARLGREGVPAVTEAIITHPEQETMWCTVDNSNGRSFVGMLQLYSDKSRTTLKESAFQFYPFHITLLNFCDEYRRQCIINGLSLVAFLPVTYYRRFNGERIKSGLDRLERLKMLHLSINCILSDLKEVAYRGFTCMDKENIPRVCHPCIGSYCCDLPEGKDLTSVKNGNHSLRNCHRCMARTETFNLYTGEVSRNGEESAVIVRKAVALRREYKGKSADELLHQHSLVEQVPSLQSFPFIGLTSVLDLHEIFNFEPLHNFHLGISKELKRCLSERLKSEDLYSSALPTKGGNNRTASFRTLRLTILFAINRMLTHIQTHSPAKGLRIDFSTSGKGSFESGLYGENGKLVGMLEAKDYKAIDMISPFIGMLVDRCCDEVATAPTTTLYVQYVDIMQMSMSYNNNSMSWTEDSISTLEKKITLFKRNALNLYGTYHASKLCTEKFHQLDHICGDIRKMGGLRSGDAGLYEHEHTDIKRANRSGSRKTNTAMVETVSSYVKDKYYRTNKGSEFPQQLRGKGGSLISRKNAIENDSTFLVKSGKSFSIRALDHGQRIVRRIRIATQEGDEKKWRETKKEMEAMDKNVQDVLEDIGEVGCRVLVNELLKSSTTPRAQSSLTKDSIIRRVASGFVSGIAVPTSDNYDKRWNKVRVSPSSTRRSQRIVSSRGFSGSAVLRQDSVLIQASDPSPSGSICLWIGKLLGLFRAPVSSCTDSNTCGKEENEFAFVQFYDTKPPVDEVDKALGCIRLVWARAQEDYGHNSSNLQSNTQPSSPWYTLIPVSSIRGAAHVIRGDYGQDGMCAVKDIDSLSWEEQYFYINRFYFDTSETDHEYDGP